MPFGHKIKAAAKEKEAKRLKAREKKFPTKVFPPSQDWEVDGMRHGPLHANEREIIERIVADQPGEVSMVQVKQLSGLLQRPESTIKGVILKAREKFAKNAERYINIHMDSAQLALANRQFGTAMQGAQWALTNLSHEGHRIIDAPKMERGDTGPKIMVGIQVGAVQPQVKIESVE